MGLPSIYVTDNCNENLFHSCFMVYDTKIGYNLFAVYKNHEQKMYMQQT